MRRKTSFEITSYKLRSARTAGKFSIVALPLGICGWRIIHRVTPTGEDQNVLDA